MYQDVPWRTMHVCPKTNIHTRRLRQAGQSGSGVTYLLCKHEDLSSIRRTHAKTRWAWGCHVKVTARARQRKVGIWGSMPATLTYLESSRPRRTEHLSKTTKQGSRGATAEASWCTTCSECTAQLIWKSKEQDPHTSGKEDGKCF